MDYERLWKDFTLCCEHMSGVVLFILWFLPLTQQHWYVLDTHLTLIGWHCMITVSFVVVFPVVYFVFCETLLLYTESYDMIS